MFGLTDFVQFPETKDTIGMWMIYVIILMVGLNVVVIIYKLFRVGVFKYRKRKMLREYKRIKENMMAKYSIKEQDDILTSVRTETPLEEVKTVRRRRLRAFKMKYIPSY